jgi:hypothetical protein
MNKNVIEEHTFSSIFISNVAVLKMVPRREPPEGLYTFFLFLFLNTIPIAPYTTKR